MHRAVGRDDIGSDDMDTVYAEAGEGMGQLAMLLHQLPILRRSPVSNRPWSARSGVDRARDAILIDESVQRHARDRGQRNV